MSSLRFGFFFFFISTSVSSTSQSPQSLSELSPRGLNQICVSQGVRHTSGWHEGFRRYANIFIPIGLCLFLCVLEKNMTGTISRMCKSGSTVIMHLQTGVHKGQRSWGNEGEEVPRKPALPQQPPPTSPGARS